MEALVFLAVTPRLPCAFLSSSSASKHKVTPMTPSQGSPMVSLRVVGNISSFASRSRRLVLSLLLSLFVLVSRAFKLSLPLSRTHARTRARSDA